MAEKNDVLLTSADLVKWREEDKKLDAEVNALLLRRQELKRRLEAAEILAAGRSAPPNETPAPLVNGHDSDDSAESAPVALIANLRKTGDSLKVQGIRTRLIELGFGEKITAQPNYTYTLVYRLSKSGKLLKRGSKYRAAPIVSPEGETEAGGASVRH